MQVPGEVHAGGTAVPVRDREQVVGHLLHQHDVVGVVNQANRYVLCPRASAQAAAGVVSTRCGMVGSQKPAHLTCRCRYISLLSASWDSPDWWGADSLGPSG